MIQTTGDIISREYDLIKIHKQNYPLRIIIALLHSIINNSILKVKFYKE